MFIINLVAGHGGNEGKTSWMNRLTNGEFIGRSQVNGEGEDNYRLKYNTNYGMVELNIIVSQTPISKCDAKIVMFDWNERATIEQYQYHSNNENITVFVCNKVQLPVNQVFKINNETVIQINSKSCYNYGAPIVAILRKLIKNDLVLLEHDPIPAPIVFYNSNKA